MATDRLRKEQGVDFEDSHVVSYEAFGANESHLHHNYPDLNYTTVDDYMDTNTLLDQEADAYKQLVQDQGIEPTDIMTAVPPCAGLSMLNAGNRGADNPLNSWMYEAVKWFVAQDCGVMIMENAPALATRAGIPVLRTIQKLLKDLGAEDVKIHLTKTSTSCHGIPQNRKRTFLYLYRGDSFKLLKNQPCDTPHIKDFLKRPKETVPGTINGQTTYPQYKDGAKDPFLAAFLKLIHESGAYEIITEKLKEKKPHTVLNTMPIVLDLFEENPELLADYEVLQHNFKKSLYKLSIGKGYWDGSPTFVNESCNAIITKNAFRTVHPVHHDRFLTFRECMDLMGIPDDFELVDYLKTFRHVFQSVPVDTAMAHLKWAEALAGKNDDLLSGTEVSGEEHQIIVQDNTKQNLENTVLSLTADNKYVKVKI
jgi:site-specific DNA-cytosine methylase